MLSQSKMQVFKISSQSDPPKVVNMIETGDETNENVELELHEQTYVCCTYDTNLYIGFVQKHSEENGDFLIQFMSPMCPSKQYFWPKVEDSCWVIKELWNLPERKITTPFQRDCTP